MVRCRVATASSFVAKVLAEVFAHFYAVAVKRHSSMGNCLFGLLGRINYERCSQVCSSHLSPFSVSVSLGFHCTSHAFFPERLSNHCQGLRRTFSEVCTEFEAVPLSDPSRNRIRPDTRLQINGSNNQHIHTNG
jgi:hypothetical protein